MAGGTRRGASIRSCRSMRRPGCRRPWGRRTTPITPTINTSATRTDAAGVAHYLFAHLDQQTVSLTANLAYTVTPALSIQWYLQPFVSRGTYANIRELRESRCGQLRRPLSPVCRHQRHQQSRRRGFEAVQFQPGGALGIPAGIDAFRRLDPGAERLPAGGGAERIERRLQEPRSISGRTTRSW